MIFGIHNSSWLDTPDPAEAFEAVKAKARWAEDHGFVWFSVMDHMIQTPRVGAPDEPVLEGWTILAALAAVTRRILLATLCTAVGYRNPAHLAKIVEKTRIQPWLLARNDSALAAKRERLAARGGLRGFIGTVTEAIDLVGQYHDAGIDLLINADRPNDAETREVFAAEVMPHFA